jgi:surfactin synthase thioesterase subunit
LKNNFLQLTQQNGQILYVGQNWTVVPGTGSISTLYMNGGHFTINQSATDLVGQLNDFFTPQQAIHKAA